MNPPVKSSRARESAYIFSKARIWNFELRMILVARLDDELESVSGIKNIHTPPLNSDQFFGRDSHGRKTISSENKG